MPPRNKRFWNMAGDSAAAVDQDLGDSTATHEGMLLLEAMQGFILPHITASISTSRQKEMLKKLSGPEARKFITALKDFISSIVGTSARMEVDTTIKVVAPKASVSYRYIMRKRLPGELPVLKPTFHNKVLQELHHRVFNRMPIRLLRFVQHGPELEISLIERAAIYQHVVSVLPSWDVDGEYKRIERRIHWFQMPTRETEDEAVSRILDKYAGYAILSHTWLRDSPEVTYEKWKAGTFDSHSPGYLKLVNFCQVAHKTHGLSFGWMDTVCINKDSSSELDESIRSMYNFYERSKVCIVYLSESLALENMRHDPWFTRGWTLQELLAPKVLKFHNRFWQPIEYWPKNDKTRSSITKNIQDATTIRLSELNNIHEYVRISRRMQLAAPRNVTREEDAAYSLMGLFNISIATAYGEGAERAFYRLLQEILNSNADNVLDLFNWAGKDCSSISKILPRRPQQYQVQASTYTLRFYDPIDPLTLTHMGIRIPLLLMPGVSYHSDSSRKPCGKYGAFVSIAPVGEYSHLPTSYKLLPQRESLPDNQPDIIHGSQPYHFTFGVFNVGKTGKDILIPSRCIAMLLACDEDSGKVSSMGPCKRIFTKEPVIFDMLGPNPKQHDSSAEDYMVKVEEREIKIPEQDLAKHGMQLVFKYL